MNNTSTGPLYDDLKEMVDNADHETVLEALTEKAHNVGVTSRGDFEEALLMLAQKAADTAIRPVLYEAMVSLQSIWDEHQPKMALQDKFWATIREGDSEAALLNYKALVKQGLDFIGTFRKRGGQLIPLVSGKEYMLLQYNKKELMIYNLRMEKLWKISVPKSFEVVDILAPPPFKSMESADSTTIIGEDLGKEIWLLMEEQDGKQIISWINIEEINSIVVDDNYIKQHKICFDKGTKVSNHLSYYRNHLLIVSKKHIYYREDSEWKEWYTTKIEITAFASTEKGFWIGHSDGDVLILKDLKHVGVRDTFKGYEEPIRKICRWEGFVLICSGHCLNVADQAGNWVLKPITTEGDIIQSTILNNEFVLIHLANGTLAARELKQGNVCWQINLGDNYESLFTLKQYLYCAKRNGEIKMFEIPHFTPMAKELENRNIHVDSQSVETGPEAPVRYISEFIGRRKLLNEIKETIKTHFLFYGEPRIGKTSLLNVLRDTLSEKAKCCYIDMTQLLKDVNSYAKFEEHFIDRCLNQHFMKISELTPKEGYLSFRAMVKKIRGAREFCVFCLDNFFIPHHFDDDNLGKFKTFLRSMLIHPSVRVMMACNKKYKEKIINYFDDSRDILERRRLLYSQIPLFTDMEVKNALRKQVSLNQEIVNEIYKYVGGFPHLVHLYDNWNVKQSSIEVYSRAIAREFGEKIFDYFRDLSSDARLLIATCLKHNLLSEKNSYSGFYENFPLLKSSLPSPLLEKALEEIGNYGDGLCAEFDGEFFNISLKGGADLFHEASRYITWLNDFSVLYEFTSAPNQDRAYNVARTFTRITQSALELDASFDEFIEKNKEIFSVNRLTDEGRRVLDMPLTTYIVIPLQPWKRESHKNTFNDLYVSIQQFERLSGKFYILLFELHGVNSQKIRDDLIGLERISIIDASRMKNIIMDKSPKERASEYIFDQLSIKERSPYTTSGAVPDELFFGREMEIQLIRGLPENIGIFGTRTIGKTSLLRKLNKDLKSQTKWKAYTMDCARIDSEELLLKNLAEKMGIPSESVSDMGKFRRYVTRDAEQSGKQYLFLLDEVDRLVKYDIKHREKIFNTFNRLCTEAIKNDEYAARFILCGFHHMFEQMKNPASRLYNFMVFLPLKSLDVKSALALVTQPIEKIRVKWKNKEDARYLVDSCSCHPRLLQAACHSLLNILDGKEGKKDLIEKSDVDRALTSADFREMCMRFYQKPEEKDVPKVEKKKSLLHPFSRKESENIETAQPEEAKKGKEYWNDLHQIAILSAIRLLYEEGKKNFTIKDIQGELKKHGLDISPNGMRIILDHLCLSGNFNLKNESMLIAGKDTDVQKKIDEKIVPKDRNLNVDRPDVYLAEETTFPKFIYEFGVKIFPKLLVAHFGGIDQCKEEVRKLVEKRDWEEWIRRY
jgi:AAA+ ATPase superfamily predicted ATPase